MTITESFQQAAIFSALLVLLVMGLGTSVSLLRMRRGIYMGDGGDKGLSRAIRAHGNSAPVAFHSTKSRCRSDTGSRGSD